MAKRVGAEIISADSMQVYQYMDIGSAKITPEEMQGVPHHMINVLKPDDEFHVVKFQEMVKGCIQEIYERGKIPILVGEPGFIFRQSSMILILQKTGAMTGTVGSWRDWPGRRKRLSAQDAGEDRRCLRGTDPRKQCKEGYPGAGIL